MNFVSWIKGILPGYIFENDSYKNYQGKGLFERYMENFGNEIDQEMYPYLTNFMDLFDALKVDEKYLVHLSFILGLPPSLDSTFDTYRKVLAYAISIYKVKGTENSYQLLFNLIGINISIIEDTPQKPALYDSQLLYDDGVTYDQECENCSGYWIVYNDQDNPGNPVPQSVLDMFLNIVNFLQPINAKLNGYVRSLYIEDEFTLAIGEEVLGFNTALGGAFSDGFETEYNFS